MIQYSTRSISFINVLFFVLIATLCVNGYYVWPKPSSISQGSGIVGVNPTSLTITTNSTSEILERSINRYVKNLIFPMGTGDNSPEPVIFTQLMVNVASDDEDLQLGVDESYSLSIGSGATSGTLTAQTIYGAMRGLETFSQLVDWSDNTTSYAINCLPTTITDTPRFAWRGLLMDTARHYLHPSTIYRTIDALSYSKFNTLHWHAVDAESFPVVSDTYPLLSEKGSYAPTAIYSHALIESVVAYAKERGIRVVPEFDMPGHAYSWGLGYPELTVSCPNYAANINNIPLNPTLNSTYTMLNAFIPEMAALFTDDCFHIGGDEVVFGCWDENEEVSQWMQERGYDAVDTLQYFENMVYPIVSGANKNAVVWEDLFDDGVTVPIDYIVEVWSDQSTLQSLVEAGYQSITAYGYYLNNQEPVPGETTSQWIDTWQLMYAFDPLEGTSFTSEQLELVLGGEAAMWGEQVDSTNYDSRVWPRACAVSERLWSPEDVTDVDDATTRLVEHRCRIARRGVGAGPIEPDYCSIPYVPYVQI